MSVPASLSAVDLSWSPKSWAAQRKANALLQPMSFDVAAGQVLGIVGPNGAGKTTLLRLLYRFNRPSTGAVMVGGVDIWSLSARSVAQNIAAVLQEQPSDFALSVREIVALGRTPHRKGFASSAGARDQEIIEAALGQLSLEHLAERHLGTLSGGERQRVMVARALAQEPSVLILDEPTNHLDIRHQLEVLDLIRTLPLTIVTTLHDLNLAASVCDAVLLLQAGRLLGFGAPEDVLCEQAVSSAFAVAARTERLSVSQRDYLTFHRLTDQKKKDTLL